ncbi:MAG TPA: hypothetical protein VGD54_06830, partial [Steroidobacteraceae bacterium]
MRIVLGLLMALNTALFVFGAIQHVGVEIGRFHEPVIVPAAIVESVCALSLLWGLWAVFRGSPALWRIIFTSNLIALAGVLLGIVALAAGRGPRTASNDNLHLIMLTLIGLSLMALFMARSFLSLVKK